ncbi:MAG: tetratricopeptide repeat protein [Thermodesulfobacteriota bacterium]
MKKARAGAVLFLLLFSFVGPSCSPKTEEECFQRADALFVDGRFEEAVETYHRYLVRFPNGRRRDQALFRSGEILYYTLGRRAPAVRHFGQVIGQHPQGEYAYRAHVIMAGVFRDEIKDYLRAVLEYKWLIMQRPEDPAAQDFQFQIARCYLMAGEYEQAVLEFGRLVEQYPDSNLLDRVYDELGGTYLILGQPQQALYIYQRLIEDFPKSPLRLAAEFKKGNALEEMHRYPEALEVYEELLGRYDNRPAVEVRIAGVKERQKQKLGEVKKVDYDYLPDEDGETMKNYKKEKK